MGVHGRECLTCLESWRGNRTSNVNLGKWIKNRREATPSIGNREVNVQNYLWHVNVWLKKKSGVTKALGREEKEKVIHEDFWMPD